jgi:V8-like Glu-specific endopeptidase
MAGHPVQENVYPDSTVVIVDTVIDGVEHRGSGVLIAPDEVLTAAHVVWDSDHGAASSAVVMPLADPFAVTNPVKVDNFHVFEVNDGNHQIALDQSQHDFALLHLHTPINGVTHGTMGIATDFVQGDLNVTGFPGNAGTTLMETTTACQRDATYQIIDYGDDLGQGSSGGPLWEYINGKPYVCGIVSSGGNGEAHAGEITSTIAKYIFSWEHQDHGEAYATQIDPSADPLVHDFFV